MRVQRKEEVYGSFEVEFSEKFEEQMRKAANEIVAFAKKDPAEAEKLLANYQGIIESSVSLLLGIIGLAFCKPAMLNYIFATLQNCLKPLSDHLKRETEIKEEQNRQNN
jgi:hypothetical protein